MVIRPVKDGPLIQCDKCNVILKTSSELNEHVGFCCKGTIDYECDTCTSVWNNPHALNVHLLFDHKLTRFTCVECGKIMRSKGNLTDHLKFVHENIRAHECPHCDLTYKSKSTLFIHVAGKHHVSSLKLVLIYFHLFSVDHVS
jgi:uncharacterized C2H2 Zn-finger protein